MKYLSLLFSVLLLLGLVGCTETSTETVQKPIYNGQQADDNDFRSTVSVARGETINNHCTGTVLAPKLVLTAGHCVTKNGYSEPRDPDELRVVERTLDLDTYKEENVFEIEKIVVHPYFPTWNDSSEDATGVGNANDIALLVLKEPLSTPPVPIYPMDMFDDLVTPGFPITLSGYGQTDTGLSGVLHIGESVYGYRSDHEVWVGSEDVATPCFGDSGGPIYIEDRSGKMFVVGVASRLGNGYWCGDGAIYTLAPAFEQWIIDNSEGLYPPEIYPEPPKKDDKCSTSGSSTGLLLFTILMALFIVNRRRRA